MMSTTAVPPTVPRKRSFVRLWLPLLILCLGALAVAAMWAPFTEAERAPRVVGTILLSLLTLLLLAGWVLFFSGWNWWLRLGLPMLLAVGVVAFFRGAVRHTEFTGDMVPVFHYVWEPSDAERQTGQLARPDNSFTTPLDLSDGRPTDFPCYRNEARDGVIHDQSLLRDWSTPPRQLWSGPIGGGYAGFAIAGNGAVTIEQRGPREAVVCYDVEIGKPRWVYEYDTLFSEPMGGDGPRATPTIAGGDVFSLGARGKLLCLEGSTGKLRWQQDILSDPDHENLQWGMSGSPLVYDNVVVVNPGVQKGAPRDHAVVAYDRTTGKEVWHAGNNKAGYSSPMLTTLAGHRQVLLFDGAGVGGYDAADGKPLWQYPWQTQQDINVAQPLVLSGDRVFISSGYGVGSALLKITDEGGELKPTVVWRSKALRCKFTSPVARGGFIYGLDDGVLVCIDQETGKARWRGERFGHGQLLLSDDLLVLLSEEGELVLVEAKPDTVHELGRFQALPKGKTWNYPAVAEGKAFVRNHHDMACYELTK